METRGRHQRRLAAIVAIDVAGYARLVGQDEEGTLSAFRAHRAQLTDPLILEHGGRIANTAGDSMILEFPSVIEAIRCAVAVQRGMEKRNAAVPEERRIRFRMGVNLGDVIADGDEPYGEGVNIAARLEQIADAGGILISASAHHQIQDRLDLPVEDLGEVEVKNIARRIRVFRIVLAADAGTSRRSGWIVGSAGRHTASRLSSPRRLIAPLALAAVAVLVSFQLPQLLGYNTADTKAGESVLEIPTGPSIAVLPIANLSGDPEQDYFADGMTEEIISSLSRFRELLVIARSTMFQYRGQSVDVSDLANELGVEYVLEGTVRKSSDRVRVTTQLIDTQTGGQIWGERFDRELSDIFDIQDEIADEIAGTLGGHYGKLAEARVRRERPTDSMEAYDYLLRSLKWWYALSPDNHREARDYLEKAIELDPKFALAHAHLSNAYLNEYVFGFNPRPDPKQRAGRHAKLAVELSPANSFCRFMLARYHFFNGELDLFVEQANKALDLNPNEPTALSELGLYFNYTGINPERGLAQMRKAMRINPAHPSWWNFIFTYDSYKKENYLDALSYANKINTPRFYRMYYVQAMTLGQLGRIEEAREALDMMLELKPSLASDRAVRDEMRKWNFPENVIDHFVEGLYKAGFEG